MSDRIIKTGLPKRFKDMLAAVIGQMSDGYWENTPMMRGYWPFVDAAVQGDEAVLEVSTDLYNREFVHNRFRDMTDDAIRKFFAEKIKFLVKEEGLGDWKRDNENETDYLSYDDPYRVKDCYYAYEVLKGRNVSKHPEYSDVGKSKKESVAAPEVVERAKNAVEELFAQMIADGAAGMRLLPDGKGVECRDQYGTHIRYANGVLVFKFGKEDAEDDLLTLAEAITRHALARIRQDNNYIYISCPVTPEEGVKLLNAYFNA